MKWVQIFFLIPFFFVQEIKAQVDSTDTEDLLINYIMPQAEFPGGPDSLFAFIKRNVRWPSPDFCGGGIEVVRFTVNKDGSLQDLKVVRSICDLCDQEAIRLVKSMPRWVPAYQNGTPIPVVIHLPIRFALE